MAVYCMSDIHGNYNAYVNMIEKIELSDEDTLYILGDCVDRGPDSVSVLQDMMFRPNVIPVIGNHEYMALSCLRVLCGDITDESIEKFDGDLMRGILEWQEVGGDETLKDFKRLSAKERYFLLEYLEEFSLYEEVSAGGNDFVLVHAGLSNFREDRPLSSYDMSEMIFETPDYTKRYFPDRYLVTGHVPTFSISGNENPGYIFKKNGHIAVDCGCGFGGRLGCIRLDDFREFYTE